MRFAPRPSRAPRRRLAVACERGSRLAVGRRPIVDPGTHVQSIVETGAWSRGLWGVFLPERRRPGTLPPEGLPERRRAAA